MKKKILFFIICIAVYIIPGFPTAEQEKKLNVYYTSSLNGNLDGCDCKGAPRAGLVKTAVYLKSIDHSYSVLLDAGDILDVQKDILLADYILNDFKNIGYDVIAVGDQEFSNGVDKLIEYRADYPFLSNNLSLVSTQKEFLFSKEPLVIEKNKLKIGILSIIEPEVFYFYSESVKNSISVNPVIPASIEYLKKLKDKKVDIIILIYHGTYLKAEEIAGKLNGIDVILIGHEQRLIDAERINNTILVSPGQEGNRVGKLELTLKEGKLIKYKNSFKYFEYIAEPDDLEIRKEIKAYFKSMRSRIKTDG